VRDLDMDLLKEVREQWAFYRDRRPDMYEPLTTGKCWRAYLSAAVSCSRPREPELRRLD